MSSDCTHGERGLMSDREKARVRAALIQVAGPTCVGMKLSQIAEAVLCRVRAQEQALADQNKEMADLRWFVQWVADHANDPAIVAEARRLGASA